MTFSPIVTLLVAAALAGPPADPGAGPSDDVIVIRRCAVDYERTTAVGSALHGVMKECLVEAGTPVKEGQVLGRLEDGDARAELKLREAAAGSDVDLRLWENRRDLAKNRLKITESLLRRNATNREEYTQHRLEAEGASIEVENAQHRRQLAAAQRLQAAALLHAREFVSPHPGVVTAVFKRRGESVAPKDPIFRVVDVDHLVVTGQVDVVDVWRLREGQPVKVTPEVAGAELPVEREVFAGRLVFIDPQVDPLSQTCKLLVKCDNRARLLRAGLEARVEIQVNGRTAGPVGGMP
jgi:RND family efflux transporter MFP subunit